MFNTFYLPILLIIYFKLNIRFGGNCFQARLQPQVAKIRLLASPFVCPSLCPQVTTLKCLNGFLLNFVLGSFTKIYRHAPTWLKSYKNICCTRQHL